MGRMSKMGKIGKMGKVVSAKVASFLSVVAPSMLFTNTTDMAIGGINYCIQIQNMYNDSGTRCASVL